MDGNWDVERGASIIYSFGPTGDVAVILSPCRSGIHNALEEYIFLRIGHYSAHQLSRRVERDFHALVAYSFVTCIDMSPTLAQYLKILWLRKTKATQIKGEFEIGKLRLLSAAIKSASKAALLATFTAIMKPIGLIVVAPALVYFAKDAWLTFITGK